MELHLALGGVRFCFLSCQDFYIGPELAPFRTPASAAPDVTTRLSLDWAATPLPHTPALGEDAICLYYEEDRRFCLTLGTSRGPESCAVYADNCREILCTLNTPGYPGNFKNMGTVLRMLPMRAIFQHFRVLAFHASQISYEGRGILFAASSGTGKSTQAALWQAHRGAKILCNDRTLVRKRGGIWRTYGYPLDGSQPVRSVESCPLGAIVLLSQGKNNEIFRLHPGKAASLLMGQAILDTWNPAAKTAALEEIFRLLEQIPVYFLSCTPDIRAVEALEEKLREDGVIRCG